MTRTMLGHRIGCGVREPNQSTNGGYVDDDAFATWTTVTATVSPFNTVDGRASLHTGWEGALGSTSERSLRAHTAILPSH